MYIESVQLSSSSVLLITAREIECVAGGMESIENFFRGNPVRTVLVASGLMTGVMCCFMSCFVCTMVVVGVPAVILALTL